MARRPVVREDQAGATVTAGTMRALVQDRYGPPETLRIAQVPRPVPREGEVVVRVVAASVNARDWHIMRGEPRVARLMDRSIFGWRGPRVRVRGTDFAGVVDAVGPEVGGWVRGDRVFGEADATLAEYVVAPADGVARVPSGVAMHHAAALPLAGTTALECLRVAGLAPGASIVVNGASGGVGTFVVQRARAQGLHVTAVCSARNAAQARALGADRVIDYASEDFVATGRTYDLVVDLVGNRSLRDLRRATAPSGSLVLSGGGVSGEGRMIGPIALLVRAQVAKRRRGPKILTPQAVPSRSTLEVLAGLLDTGALAVPIERTFELQDAAGALRHLEREHARAKVVVAVSG